MQNLISNWLVNKYHNENFTDNIEKENIQNNYKLIVALFFIVLSQIFLLFFGKFLWNNYLIKSVNIVNPINSVWELLAISILVKLIIY